MTHYNRHQETFSRISVQQLRDALNDPRLPKSFLIEGVHDYPALAIRTDETDREDPDGLWYIGYIDLFDGTYHPRERGEQDGVNPSRADLVMVVDPEVVRAS